MDEPIQRKYIFLVDNREYVLYGISKEDVDAQFKEEFDRRPQAREFLRREPA